MGQLESAPQDINKIVNQFFTLSDYAYNDKHIKELQRIADEKLIPLVNSTSSDNKLDIIDMIHRTITHAEQYVTNLIRERQNLAKLV